MKLLNEISDGSLGLSDEYEQLNDSYRLRKSARAILCNTDGDIATQYLKNHAYHKLPGGGVDPGESIATAMCREVREEVGCDCEVGRGVGITIEYRSKHKLLHISYCFVATVRGEIGAPELEAGEIEEGQETLWLPPETVLEKMEHDTPQKYSSYFVLEREKTFLREYLSTQR